MATTVNRSASHGARFRRACAGLAFAMSLALIEGAGIQASAASSVSPEVSPSESAVPSVSGSGLSPAGPTLASPPSMPVTLPKALWTSTLTVTSSAYGVADLSTIDGSVAVAWVKQNATQAWSEVWVPRVSMPG